MPAITPSTDRRTRKRIAAALAQLDLVLPGSIPPELHGPYIQWTRKVEGKTITRYLRPDQLERCQTGFDNARRLRELITELEALSLRATEPDPKP